MSMNLGLKVLVVLVCLSFMFTIAPRPCTAAELAGGADSCYGYGTGWNTLASYFAGESAEDSIGVSNLLALLALAGAVVAVTTALFPNAFTLFAGFVSAIFLVFVSVPWDLLSGTESLGFGEGDPFGAILIQFFIMILVLLVTIAMLSFYKGNDF